MKRRLLWTGLGLALALTAVLLVARIARPRPAVAPGVGAEAGASSTAPAPQRWSDFAVPDEEEIPRPSADLGLSAAEGFSRGLAQLTAGGGGPALRLQAIVTGDRPMALISGQILKPGDSIAGYRLTRIEGAGVTLRGADAMQRLELSGGAGAEP